MVRMSTSDGIVLNWEGIFKNWVDYCHIKMLYYYYMSQHLSIITECVDDRFLDQ